VKTLARGLLLILCLAVLASCHRHRPAPIEEHSASNTKRELNSDGSYSVRSGDTLFAIAFSYGLDHRDVATWNRIATPYVIHPGQKLRLTQPPSGNSRNSGKSATVQTSGIKTPGATTTTAHTSSTPPPVTQKAAAPKQVEAAPSPKSTPVAKTTTTSASADPQSWRWPANGRVLRGYVAANPSRNGLDIVGTEGQPIMASATGKVVYSGNGLLGYGELIIIKHSDRMLSAYAHNKLRLVQEGEQVSAGQKIAEMGRNDENEQLLHFEIRVRGKPVNPTGYLPPK
jgi:lipoprotein NlpD